MQKYRTIQNERISVYPAVSQVSISIVLRLAERFFAKTVRTNYPYEILHTYTYTYTYEILHTYSYTYTVNDQLVAVLIRLVLTFEKCNKKKIEIFPQEINAIFIRSPLGKFKLLSNILLEIKSIDNLIDIYGYSLGSWSYYKWILRFII